ncbi:hypothetical protein SAY87_027726 [Trapa incisa]|uniref:FeS cluster biogenesis domain-containing protein n=1 Tax=Trapa incisa TaxID=236973 RepID=A0AAN7JNC2_9MYRT|nr:hypothetical protein SAY87_027726 [Trapa incisa]
MKFQSSSFIAHGMKFHLDRSESWLKHEKGKFDELVEDKGVKFFIEPKALMHVIGTKMDFVDDKLSPCSLMYPSDYYSLGRSEFVFGNPNSKGQCGCGESFMTVSSAEVAKRGGS